MSIEAYQGGASVAQTVDTFGRLADTIANTEFVPKAMRGKPAVVLACMMYGAELGLGPMQALRLIDIIEGTPALKPEGMRAMVRQAGHKIWPEERNGQSCTMAGYRAEDGPEMTVRATWGFEDAKRAGLASKSNYQKMPRAMYDARATAELCRLHFADVIGGLSYVPEEIEDFDQPAPTPSFRPAPTASLSYPQAVPIRADAEPNEPFPDTPALAPAPSPVAPPVTRRRAPPVVDSGELVDTKGAQRLHIKASSKTDAGHPIDETTLRVLIYGQTKGRTDSAAEVTLQEADVIETRINAARNDRLPETFADRADEWLVWTEKKDADAAPAAAETVEEPDLFAEVTQ